MQVSTNPQLYTQFEVKKAKRAKSVIFFIMVMDIIGLSILIPVAPYIVQRYSDDALMVTLVSAIYAAAQFFSAPLLGKISDRLGRRPILLISIFGSAIGYVIFGVGGALWVLFLSRLIDGITAGNLSTATAYLADTTKPDERANAFVLVGMAYGIGFVVGPGLGTVFSHISLQAPAFVAAALSLLAVLLGFFFLPESLPLERRERQSIRLNDLNPLRSIGQIARKPRMGWVLSVYSLFQFAFNGLNSIAVLFMAQKFKVEASQVGVVLVLIGISNAFVQAALVPRLVPRYGEKAVAVGSFMVMGITTTAIFLSPNFGLIYPLSMLNAAASGFIFPTLAALMANWVEPHEQGALNGVSAALTGLMGVLGPLAAGLIYDHTALGTPYWLAALAFLLSGLLLSRMKRQTTHALAVEAAEARS